MIHCIVSYIAVIGSSIKSTFPAVIGMILINLVSRIVISGVRGIMVTDIHVSIGHSCHVHIGHIKSLLISISIIKHKTGVHISLCVIHSMVSGISRVSHLSIYGWSLRSGSVNNLSY